MFTLEIPQPPTSNVLGSNAFHRNQHNDRTAWQRRVQLAVSSLGLHGLYAIVQVKIDWGTRSHLRSTAARNRLADELEGSLLLAGIQTVSRAYPLDEEETGVGRGTVTVHLEPAT